MSAKSDYTQKQLPLATHIDRYNKAVNDYLAYGNYLKEKWEKQDPVQEMREFLAQYK